MLDDQPFFLDSRLSNDTIFVANLALSDLRLMNDSRWPWFILVPRLSNVEEIHHLSHDDQKELYKEIYETAMALEAMTGCLKINTAALGNIVRQLHIHIIARHENDENWPNPVWGYGQRVDYEPKVAETLIKNIQRQLRL